MIFRIYRNFYIIGLPIIIIKLGLREFSTKTYSSTFYEMGINTFSSDSYLRVFSQINMAECDLLGVYRKTVDDGTSVV